MPDTLDILRKLALQIRNASSEGENTAERVGRTLVGILNLLSKYSPEELEKIFLRKDRADGTPFPITSEIGSSSVSSSVAFPEVVSIRMASLKWKKAFSANVCLFRRLPITV